MPLSKDEKVGGTEADYCSHCYADGQFTEPDLSADEMVEKVRGKLKEMHLPGFLATARHWKVGAPLSLPNSGWLAGYIL
jgi:hypothetical protein